MKPDKTIDDVMFEASLDMDESIVEVYGYDIYRSVEEKLDDIERLRIYLTREQLKTLNAGYRT